MSGRNVPEDYKPPKSSDADAVAALDVIAKLAERGKAHTSKFGQDFLEWIIEITEGADPEAIYEAARSDYEDPEEEPWT
jgi:hypothetical protein